MTSRSIVVVDSQTGEVRQCGNLSGHCIAHESLVGPARRAGRPRSSTGPTWSAQAAASTDADAMRHRRRPRRRASSGAAEPPSSAPARTPPRTSPPSAGRYSGCSASNDSYRSGCGRRAGDARRDGRTERRQPAARGPHRIVMRDLAERDEHPHVRAAAPARPRNNAGRWRPRRAAACSAAAGI